MVHSTLKANFFSWKMESIIWSNGRIRKLSIFMFWIPKQLLGLDVRKETLRYCLKKKEIV